MMLVSRFLAWMLTFAVAAIPTACSEWMTPATDVTAVYRSLGGDMRFEVAKDGTVRFSTGKLGSYALVRGGEAYTIRETPRGPVAERGRDVAAAMKALGVAGRFIDRAGRMGAVEFVERDAVRVNGRTGRGFHMRNAEGLVSSRPVFVMSDDPALARLGRGVRAYFQAASTITDQALGGGEQFAKVQEVLGKGAPLLMFGRAGLVAVDTKPVPAARFALPRVATYQEVLERMRAEQQRLRAP